MVVSCGVRPPEPDTRMPDAEIRRTVARRMAAVLVTDHENPARWSSRGLPTTEVADDADGGSATPVAPDGYFLTADHVLSRMPGRNVFVLHPQAGRLVPCKARVVWRSKQADLALLHIPVATPHFYRWTPAEAWLPAGTGVIHGGIATGLRSPWGQLVTDVPPERTTRPYQRFKIDIPLEPGDSGGPVVDADGGLVGINSAVEFLVPMETAFFVDSEANRPHLRKLEARIRTDRKRNNPGGSSVD
jgi:S1-C subfamily serine protease